MSVSATRSPFDRLSEYPDSSGFGVREADGASGVRK